MTLETVIFPTFALTRACFTSVSFSGFTIAMMSFMSYSPFNKMGLAKRRSLRQEPLEVGIGLCAVLAEIQSGNLLLHRHPEPHNHLDHVPQGECDDEGKNPDRHDARRLCGEKLEPAAEEKTVPGCRPCDFIL